MNGSRAAVRAGPGKKLVVLAGSTDWAGSCNAVCRAVNRAGRIACRHVTLYRHEFGFPADIVIPVLSGEGGKTAADYPREHEEAMALFDEADLVHLWNDTLPVLGKRIAVPADRVRSCTFTGTLYRTRHAGINRQLKSRNIRLVVQNPAYRFPEEYDAEFIPHAVDTDRLQPLPPDGREAGTIGCYRPVHANTSAREDIERLASALRAEHPGWRITLNTIMPWEERMRGMARCRYFFEYMDPAMGYWGRSALEACALGVPAFSFVSPEALRLSDGRIGEPAVVHVERGALREVLERYLNLPEASYRALAERSRQWVETFYGFDAVGGLYTDFFLRVLGQG